MQTSAMAFTSCQNNCTPLSYDQGMFILRCDEFGISHWAPAVTTVLGPPGAGREKRFNGNHHAFLENPAIKRRIERGDALRLLMKRSPRPQA